MTAESAASIRLSGLGNTLAQGWATCACGRAAQRGKVTCWFCDPDVTQEAKLEARRRVPAEEVALLLAAADLASLGGRDDVREKLLELRAGGRISSNELKDYLSVVDSAAKDPGRQRQPIEDAKPLVVEVARFGQATSSEAAP